MNRQACHTALALAAIASLIATANAVRAKTVVDLQTEGVYCQDVFPPLGRPFQETVGGGPCAPSAESPTGVGDFPWVYGRTTYRRNVFYYYRFTYSDDGRPTGDSTFESATLSFTPQPNPLVYTINYVLGAPVDAFSIESGPAIVLGNNDHPDSFSGAIRVDVTASGAPGSGGGYAFGGITPVWLIDSASDGGVAPIPEPSTFALLLSGLGAITWMGLRQARR